MIDIEWLIVIFVLFVLTLTAFAGKSFAPWVPIWKKDLPRVLKLAQLQPGEVFYDLGCGNGKVVFYIAKETGNTSVGVELSPLFYAVCLLRRLLHPHLPTQIHFGNLFSHSLESANVIYVFGMPKTLQKKLAKKLRAELKPSTRVISYTFPIHGFTPTSIERPTARDLPLYLYTI